MEGQGARTTPTRLVTMITPTPIQPGDDDEFSQMAEIPDTFASLSPESEPQEPLPVPAPPPKQEVAPSVTPSGRSGLETYLAMLPPGTREAVLKRARRQGLSDTDPIWEIVLAVRERDEDFRADILKSPEILKEAVAELHLAIDELKSTAGAERTVAKKLDESNSRLELSNKFLIKEADWQGKLLIGVACALVLTCSLSVWGSMELRDTKKAIAALNDGGLIDQLKIINKQSELVRRIHSASFFRMQLEGYKNSLNMEVIALKRAASEGQLSESENERVRVLKERQKELDQAWDKLAAQEKAVEEAVSAFNEGK